MVILLKSWGIKHMKKNIYILLNAWALASIGVVVAIVIYLASIKSISFNFSSLIIFCGIIIAGILCILNIKRILTLPKEYKFNTINNNDISYHSVGVNSGLPGQGYQPVEDTNKNYPPQGDNVK